MSSKSEIKNIKLIESKPYLTKTELALLLEKKERNLDKKISQLIRDEILISLKKGLYLSRIFYLKNKNDIEEYLSNIIFYPSYISLEYVLAKEGLIPESVFSYTCVTLKTTRQFSNKLGRFTYRKIKEKLFTGFVQKNYYDNYKIRIATKSKALFDYLYYKPIKKLEEIDDLRINWQNLSEDDLLEFAQYIDLSASKKITNPYKDKQFIEIFDPLKNYQTRLKEKCIFPGILDLNLDNLIYDSKYNKIYLIDWEWTYDFPISESFASFRSLFYLSFKLQSLITTFCSIDFPCYEIFDNFYIPKIWWDMFSFSQEDAKKFLFYEFNFQNSVNIIKVDFKKINIFKEKKLINKRVSLNLESYIRSLISQKILDTNNNQVELEGAKKELAQTKIENKNLEKSLNQIKSAKFFKLWQGYCKLRDSIIKHHKV